MHAVLVPKWLWRLVPRRWRTSTVGTFKYPVNQHGAYDSYHNLTVLYYKDKHNVGKNHVTFYIKFSK